MASLKFDITGDNTQLLRTLRQTQQNINQTIVQIERNGKQVEGVFSKLGTAIDGITKNAVGGMKQMASAMVGFAAIQKAGDFMGEMVTNVAQFNKAMKEVSTISKEVTYDMQGYKQAVVALTTEIPIGATEAAKALYQIVSAGQQGADALNVLKVAAKAAVGGVTETATAADTITTLLNAYHLKASDAEAVSDKLFTTVRLGKTTMTELGASIAQAAPTAAAYGVSMNELLGAVATLTKQGVPTALAMTQINAAITEAVNVLGDSAFEGRTFAEALGQIRDSADGSMTALKGQITNIRALKGALGLTGDSAKTAASDLEAMANSAGAAQDAFDKMNDTAGASATRLKNNFQATFAPIGEGAKSISKTISDSLNEAFATGAMDDFKTTLLGLVAVYGTYKTAVMITTAIEAARTAGIGVMTTAEIAHYGWIVATEKAQRLLNATMLANPYVALATAAAVLAVAVYKIADADTGAAAAQKNFNNELREAKQRQKELNAENQKNIDLCNDDTKTTGERQKALESLIARYPGIIQKYIDEEGHLTNILQLKREIAEIDGQNSIASNRNNADKSKRYAQVMRKVVANKNDVSKLTAEERELYKEANEKFNSENDWTTALASNNASKAEYFEQQAKEYTKQANAEVTDRAIEKFRQSLSKRNAEDIAKWQNVLTKANAKFKNGIKRVTVKGLGELSQAQVQMLLSQTTQAGSKSTGGEGSTKDYAYWEKLSEKYEAEMKKYEAGTKEFNEARKKYLQAEAEKKKYSANDGSASAQKSAEQQNKENADNAQKLADAEIKHTNEIAKQKADAILQARQYEINARIKGTEKVLAQIKLDYDKEVQAIENDKKAAIKANEDAARDLWEAQNPNADKEGRNWESYKKSNNLSFGLTAEQQSMFAERINANEVNRQRAIEQANQESLRSMLDYLKEYGTLEQQKLAITEEYEQKIADARRRGDEWGVKSLEKERDAKVSSYNAQSLAQGIDWTQVMSGVGTIVTEVANETLKRIDEYTKTDEYKKLSATDKKSIGDLRSQVVKSSSSADGGAFGFGAWGKIEKLAKEYQDSLKRLAQASSVHKSAVEALTKAKEDEKKATTDAEKVKAKQRVSQAQSVVNSTATEVNNAQSNLDKTQSDLTDTTQQATQGLDNFSKVLGQITSGSISGFATALANLINGGNKVGDSLGEIGGKAGGLIGAILTLIDVLGDKPVEFIDSLFTKIENVVQSVLSNLPQIVISIVKGVGGIIKGVFAGIGGLFGLDTAGDSDKNYARDMERLTRSNEALQTSIDNLSAKIAGDNIVDAISDYQKALRQYKEIEANTQQQMRRSGDASSKGFAGMGSASSSNVKIQQNMSSEDWEKVSRAAGVAVNNASDFWNLTSEQMWKVATEEAVIYANIKDHADDGYKDAGQYMDAYTQLWQQAKQKAQEYAEYLTGISYDSMKSDFKSALMDMDSSFSDFADSVEEKLTSALVEAALNAKGGIYESLASLQTELSDMIESAGGDVNNISQTALEAWMDEYMAEYAKGKELTESIYERTGYSKSSGEAKGTINSAMSMTEDTGNELVGRMTAIQMSVERNTSQNSALATQILSGITSLTLISTGLTSANENLSNILLQMQTANGYLFDITAFNEKMYKAWDKRFSDMYNVLNNKL